VRINPLSFDRGGGTRLFVEPPTIVHETGHLTVGLCLGLDEYGIGFAPPAPGHAAGAWARNLDHDPGKAVVRALAGLLAHLYVLPNTIKPDTLRDAYRRSIILTPDHPDFSNVTAEDRRRLSGAETDMNQARRMATLLHPNDEKALISCLRGAEDRARSIVNNNSNTMLKIIQDIEGWSREPERLDDALLIYPATRAKEFLG
jgi:hypothetical protein